MKRSADLGRSSRFRDQQRVGPALILALWLPLLLGAERPEILRLHVPSETLSSWFPEQAGLRGMPLQEFEALVRSTAGGQTDSRPDQEPHLLRARHEARWEDQILHGRSILLIENQSATAADLELSPWSPALIEAPKGAELRERGAKAALVLRVPPASTPSTVELSWQFRSRPGSNGRSFDLELPVLDAASLILDLPDDLIPEELAGDREGPLPGPEPQRLTWRIDGPGGPMDLRLRPPTSGQDDAPSSLIWVQGTTTINLEATTARWRTTWIVNPGERGSRPLEVMLDPQLEWTNVTGPAVVGFRAVREPEGTRLVIRLNAATREATVVTVEALTRFDESGPWSIPAMRPVNAVWTGGRTVVRLGDSWALAGCRERWGRQVAPRAEPPEERTQIGPVLEFEARQPRSVADLWLRRRGRSITSTAEVVGTIDLQADPPEFQAQVTLGFDREAPRSLGVSLSSGWRIEEVRSALDQEPWRWEPSGDSSSDDQFHVSIPSGSDDTTIQMLVTGVASSSGGLEATGLDFPRLRVLDHPNVEEVWSAVPGPDVQLRPVEAVGLAWIDPTIETLPGGLGASARSGLAWRWTAPEGRGRFKVQRNVPQPSATIQQFVMVAAGRLTLIWNVNLDLGATPEVTVPLQLVPALGSAPTWKVLDGTDGPPLRTRPLDAAQRRDLGFDDQGESSAWELQLPQPTTGSLRLVGRLELDWPGQGQLPLPRLPEKYRVRNLIMVLVDSPSRSWAEGPGLRALDPQLTWNALATQSSAMGLEDTLNWEDSTTRLAHVYRQEGSAGQLALRTEALPPSGTSGLIQQATLASTGTPSGPLRHQLTLEVVAMGSEPLEIALPEGSTLERALRDGQPLAPTRKDSTFQIHLSSIGNASRRRLIRLDYRTPSGAASGQSELRPHWPEFSWPCLALSWSIAAPEPWTILDAGPDLIGTDPAAPSGWGTRLLGAWPDVTARNRIQAEAAMVRDFESRVENTPRVVSTLAEQLLRWNGGRWPIVVDRQALETAGWGPDSTVDWSWLDRNASASLPNALRWMGLSIVPIGSTFLLTTPIEAPQRAGRFLGSNKDRYAWEEALLEAVAWGSDRTDRFQTVERWQREPTLGADSLNNSRRGGGALNVARPARRYETMGLPTGSVRVRLTDSWTWIAGSCLLLVLLVGLGAAVRDRSLPARTLGLATILTLGWLGLWLGGPVVSTLAAGLVWGGIAVGSYWIGHALRRSPALHPGISSRNRGSRSATKLTVPSLVVVLGLGLGGMVTTVLAQPHPGDGSKDEPVVVLIPYDGPTPDPNASNPTVWLRLDDLDRLTTWAGQRLAGPRASVTASNCQHRVRFENEREILVESRFELWYDAQEYDSEPVTWSIPLGEARDLSASLDGERIDPIVAGGGQRATIEVSGRAGRRELVVRRRFPRQATESGERLVLTVVPVASSQVIVEPCSDAEVVTVPTARGLITPRPDGTVEGQLGPADLLEVHWSNAPAAAPDAAVRMMEGLLLWSVEPGGDGLDARLAIEHPDGEGTTTARFRLGPGVLPRSVSAVGVAVLAERLETEPNGSTTWSFQFEPPLPDGGTLWLELWRPIEALDHDERNGNPVRRPPYLEPLDVNRYSGSLAMLRPPDWTGRLEPDPDGPDLITEEVFDRLWGGLPRGPLTLRGAIRFLAAPEVGVATHPVVPRREVSDSILQLDLSAGRIDWRLDATLNDLEGRSFEIPIHFPDAVQFKRVEANGLTHWDEPSPGRLRLRFDGPWTRTRTLKLEGWIPLALDPIEYRPQLQEQRVPTPTWPGAQVGPGLLKLTTPIGSSSERSAADRPRIEYIGQDRTVKVLRPVEDPLATTLGRIAYLENLEQDARLRWSVFPSISVSILSQLTMLPQSAEWEALVRYESRGGPGEEVQLKLATGWTERTRFELVGHGVLQPTQQIGNVVRLRLPEPFWGAATLQIRAVRPHAATTPLDFPELVPLGRGSLSSYQIAIVSATDRTLSFEALGELEATDATVFREADWPLPPGATRRAYRVRGRSDLWSLEILPTAEDAEVDELDSARVTLAELEGVVSRDGSCWGIAHYHVEPRTDPFLSVAPPPRSRVLAAMVDGRSTRPRMDAEGNWLVPLGQGLALQVDLIWVSPATQAPPATTARPLPIPLPTLKQPGVPTFVTVYADESDRIRVVDGPLVPTVASALEAERLNQHADRLEKSVHQLDRGSSEAIAALTLQLVRFERLALAGERAARWGALHVPTTSSTIVHRQSLRQISQHRQRVADTLNDNGLLELGQFARARLGLEPELEATTDPIRVPSTGLRLRRLGVPHSFRFETNDQVRQAEVLGWSPGLPSPAFATLPNARLFVLALGFVVLSTTLIAAEWWRSGWPVVPLLGLIGAAFLAAAPLAALGVLVLFGAGRSTRPVPEEFD